MCQHKRPYSGPESKTNTPTAETRSETETLVLLRKRTARNQNFFHMRAQWAVHRITDTYVESNRTCKRRTTSSCHLIKCMIRQYRGGRRGRTVFVSWDCLLHRRQQPRIYRHRPTARGSLCGPFLFWRRGLCERIVCMRMFTTARALVRIMQRRFRNMQIETESWAPLLLAVGPLSSSRQVRYLQRSRRKGLRQIRLRRLAFPRPAHT